MGDGGWEGEEREAASGFGEEAKPQAWFEAWGGEGVCEGGVWGLIVVGEGDAFV